MPDSGVYRSEKMEDNYEKSLFSIFGVDPGFHRFPPMVFAGIRACIHTALRRIVWENEAAHGESLFVIFVVASAGLERMHR